MRYRNRWLLPFICILSLGQIFSLLAQESSIRREARKDKRVVRVVYLVPADRTFRSKYSRRIKAAIANVQVWYQEQMGDEKTFRLPHLPVHVVRTNHTAAWYGTSPVNGADASLWFWFNVLADAFSATGAEFFDPTNRWIFYIDADPLCGQAIGAGGGVALHGGQRPARPHPPAERPGLFLGTAGHGRSLPLGRWAWA